MYSGRQKGEKRKPEAGGGGEGGREGEGLARKTACTQHKDVSSGPGKACCQLSFTINRYSACHPGSVTWEIWPEFNGAFPPAGAGRFGAGREGVIFLRSVMCHFSTADSTLMVGGV